MPLTLDVSKLSGWLNADAICRVSQGGHTVRREVQRTGWPEAAGDRGASSVQGRARLQIRSTGHGEERTLNMLLMSVTLEVLKLSGWLNAVAACRESNRGRAMCEEVQSTPGGGRCQATAVQAACRGEGSTADWGQGTGRSARRTCLPWL